MGIFNWLKHNKKEMPAGKGFTSSLAGVLGLSGQTAFTDLSLLEIRLAIAYACTRLIATSANEPTLRTGRVEEEGFQAIPTDQESVVKAPAPYVSYSQMIEQIVFALYSQGEAFLIKQRNTAGTVINLIPVAIGSCSVTVDTTNALAPYRAFTISGKSYAPHDVVFFRFPDPSNPWRGLSPLVSAARSIALDAEQSEYQMSMLKNTSVAGAVVTTDRELDQEQLDLLAKKLASATGGTRRGHFLVLSGGGADYKETRPLSDLDWHGLSNLTESRICMAFGVPPALVGARVGIESTPLSSASLEPVQRVFWRQTMVPLLYSIAEVLTRDLLQEEGLEDLVFDFDLSTVSALQDDQAKMGEQAVRLFSGGLVTRDEARALVEYAPMPDLSGPVISLSNSATEQTVESAPIATPTGEETMEQNTQTDGQGGALLSMVGGLQTAISLIQSVSTGVITRESAIALFQMFYKVSRQEAEAAIGNPEVIRVEGAPSV